MSVELAKLNNLYKNLHSDDSVYPGFYTLAHIEKISKLVLAHNCKSILDHGAGKGHQYTKESIHKEYFAGVMPALYDPGVPEFSTLPSGMFDAVISCDVLEHIPESLLDEVLGEIFNKATKCVFLGINNTNSVKILDDGRDTHLTVKKSVWWINKIKPFATKHTVVHCYGALEYCYAEFKDNVVSEFILQKTPIESLARIEQN